MFGNLVLILANRSDRFTTFETLRLANRALWIVVSLAVCALLTAIYVPTVAGVFRFAPIGPSELGIAALCGAASVLWFDALKVMHRSKRAHVGRG